jgi:hypothetical protein
MTHRNLPWCVVLAWAQRILISAVVMLLGGMVSWAQPLQLRLERPPEGTAIDVRLKGTIQSSKPMELRLQRSSDLSTWSPHGQKLRLPVGVTSVDTTLAQDPSGQGFFRISARESSFKYPMHLCALFLAFNCLPPVRTQRELHSFPKQLPMQIVPQQLSTQSQKKKDCVLSVGATYPLTPTASVHLLAPSCQQSASSSATTLQVQRVLTSIASYSLFASELSTNLKEQCARTSRRCRRALLCTREC